MLLPAAWGPLPAGGSEAKNQKQKKHRANLPSAVDAYALLAMVFGCYRATEPKCAGKIQKKNGREVSACTAIHLFDSVFYLLMPHGASLMNACTFGALACYLCLPWWESHWSTACVDALHPGGGPILSPHSCALPDGGEKKREKRRKKSWGGDSSPPKKKQQQKKSRWLNHSDLFALSRSANLCIFDCSCWRDLVC